MIVDIINKKRLGKELSYSEIDKFFNAYLDGDIKDYQMSALLMAICINGMTDEEVFALTKVFIDSGDVLDFSGIIDNMVDKHSTGGIGDKTTLVIAPIVAACGVPVVKMSGRGLGYTGGTIDKLESIGGFKTNLTDEQIIKQVKDIGVVITSQTANLTPMDKAIYALRDVTGTVSSIPLIASSIMSKKIAGGADSRCERKGDERRFRQARILCFGRRRIRTYACRRGFRVVIQDCGAIAGSAAKRS